MVCVYVMFCELIMLSNQHLIWSINTIVQNHCTVCKKREKNSWESQPSHFMDIMYETLGIGHSFSRVS